MTAHVGLPHLHRYATALTFLALTTTACSAGSDTFDTDTAAATTTTAPAASASVTASGEPSPTASETARGPVLPGLIAFRRYSIGSESDGTLFSIATDGSHERLLVKPPAGTSLEDPDWAPGGGLLYSRIGMADTETHQLVLAGPGGRHPRLLNPTSPGTLPDGDAADRGVFSPDGRSIAYVRGSGKVTNDQLQHVDIWISDADGSHRRNLTKGASYSADRNGVAWSPEGSRLVFSLAMSASGSPANGLALFVINADGSGLRRLTPWKLGAGGPPDWSSHDLIAFRAVDDEESGIGNFFTIRPDGTHLTQVTHFADTVVSHKVSFSPDGRWIAFARSDSAGANDIYIASIDGKHVYPVIQTHETESSPDWGPVP